MIFVKPKVIRPFVKAAEDPDKIRNIYGLKFNAFNKPYRLHCRQKDTLGISWKLNPDGSVDLISRPYKYYNDAWARDYIRQHYSKINEASRELILTPADPEFWTKPNAKLPYLGRLYPVKLNDNATYCDLEYFWVKRGEIGEMYRSIVRFYCLTVTVQIANRLRRIAVRKHVYPKSITPCSSPLFWCYSTNKQEYYLNWKMAELPWQYINYLLWDSFVRSRFPNDMFSRHEMLDTCCRNWRYYKRKLRRLTVKKLMI